MDKKYNREIYENILKNNGNIFSHNFAKKLWGDELMKVGLNIRSLPKWVHNLKAMSTYENPHEFIEKFFIDIKKINYKSFVFNEDIFLNTKHPYCKESFDHWSPPELDHKYHYKPLSLICDFLSGKEMALGLLKMFPDKKKLLDLGTATGSVPLTMRKVGMQAVGLDGLPVNKFDIENYMLQKPELFAWNVCPNIVSNCDITYPFSIKDKNGNIVKFDYIISTDCFEHLIPERLNSVFLNIDKHLAKGGYGIFDIHLEQFMGMHQTILSADKWIELIEEHFVIEEELSKIDFSYIRSDKKNGKLFTKKNKEVNEKLIIWVSKKG